MIMLLSGLFFFHYFGIIDVNEMLILCVVFLIQDKGMFIAVQPDKCSACEKTVYAMEKLEMNKNIYHRGCFKCSHCSARLT